MLKGFVSGIAVCLVVTAATFIFAGASSALGDKPGTSASIWSGLWHGALFASPAPDTSDNTATDDIWQITDQPDQPAQDRLPPSSTAPTPNAKSYVALGDSVASGLGLPYLDGATAQDRRCGRSSQAYAHEVGRQLGYETRLYACSGASSGDLYTRQWISNSNPYIQLNQAFTQGTPDLISITIGANDISWSRLIRQCYYGTCGTDSQIEELTEDIVDMQENIQYALRQIQLRSTDQPPVVILTGYYNPVSSQCTTLYPERITTAEINWVNHGVQALNQALRDTAAHYSSFARFVPIDFSGHDLCSGASWVQGLGERAPIHPTVAGQQAIARSVIQAAN